MGVHLQADGFLEKSWQAHSWFVGGLAWSPNGTEIVTTGNAGSDLDVATRVASGSTRTRLRGGTAWIVPDGRLSLWIKCGPAIYDVLVTNCSRIPCVAGTNAV